MTDMYLMVLSISIGGSQMGILVETCTAQQI